MLWVFRCEGLKVRREGLSTGSVEGTAGGGLGVGFGPRETPENVGVALPKLWVRAKENEGNVHNPIGNLSSFSPLT